MESRVLSKKRAEDVKDMEVPSIEDVTEETLKILFWRMKNDPSAIKTSELVPFAIQALRALEQKGNKQQSSLAEKLGQLSDARTNQEG